MPERSSPPFGTPNEKGNDERQSARPSTEPPVPQPEGVLVIAAGQYPVAVKKGGVALKGVPMTYSTSLGPLAVGTLSVKADEPSTYYTDKARSAALVQACLRTPSGAYNLSLANGRGEAIGHLEERKKVFTMVQRWAIFDAQGSEVGSVVITRAWLIAVRLVLGVMVRGVLPALMSSKFLAPGASIQSRGRTLLNLERSMSVFSAKARWVPAPDAGAALEDPVVGAALIAVSPYVL